MWYFLVVLLHLCVELDHLANPPTPRSAPHNHPEPAPPVRLAHVERAASTATRPPDRPNDDGPAVFFHSLVR